MGASTERVLYHTAGEAVTPSPHLLVKETFCGAISPCHMSWQDAGTLPWQFATLLSGTPGHFILETTAMERLTK